MVFFSVQVLSNRWKSFSQTFYSSYVGQVPLFCLNQNTMKCSKLIQYLFTVLCQATIASNDFFSKAGSPMYVSASRIQRKAFPLGEIVHISSFHFCSLGKQQEFLFEITNKTSTLILVDRADVVNTTRIKNINSTYYNSTNLNNFALLLFSIQ